MFKRSILLVTTLLLGLGSLIAHSWDHPGHMVTAAVAFKDIRETRPELVDKLQLLFLSHPDPAPFWVAAGEAKGEERTRRMFLECARWPDDSKFTNNDRLSWHSARWPLLAADATAEARTAVEALNGRPIGQGIEALELNFAMLRNHESSQAELAWSLCWLMHIVGDIHQPWHVTELYSAEFPTGNAAGGLSYVDDPLTDTTIPLHILWDSNYLRTPSLAEVDSAASAFREKNPRSSYPELESHPIQEPGFFRQWTRESHQIALDWAADIEAVRDLESDQDAETLVRNMVNFILNGISPVKEAPEVPADYWDKLKQTSERRITLAGYRIADLLITAADDIEAQRKFIGN